ncbi:hypothetical protein [Chitinophaga agrisoli]|nr:hypothetical protein [Chitinophaga agrisoli]
MPGATSCTCNCLKPLFDYLIASHRLFTPATDNMLVSSLVQDATDAGYTVDYTSCAVLNDNINKTFYAVTTEQTAAIYKARIGDCVVSLKSLNGNPVTFDQLASDACSNGTKVTYRAADLIRVSLPVTEGMTLYNVIASNKLFTDPFYTTSNTESSQIVKDTLSQKMVAALQNNYDTATEPNLEQYQVYSFFRFAGVSGIPANATIKTAYLMLYAYPEGFMPPVYTKAHITSAEEMEDPVKIVMPPRQWSNSTTDFGTLQLGGDWGAVNGRPEIHIDSSFENISFDIHNYIQYWQTNENKGLALVAMAPSWNKTPFSYATFCSHKYPDAAKRPRVDITYTGSASSIVAELQVDSCYACTSVSSGICYSAITDTSVNPYLYGLAGNWRPSKAYTYYGARTSAAFGQHTDIRRDGATSNFLYFWGPDNFGKLSPQYNDAVWVWNSESTLFNRKGFELENKDPLGRYNAGLYGYDHTLPIAVIQNSHYRESAFDGFEDYFFEPNLCDTTCSGDRNFDFSLYKAKLDTIQKHTGKYSLRVESGSSAGISAPLVSGENDVFGLTVNTAVSDCGDGSQVLKSVRLNADALLPVFSPISGKQALLSAWVKEAQECHCMSYTGSQVSIVVETPGGNQVFIAKPAGNIIEGWQRVEQVVDIPTSATRISINLQSTGNTAVYFDDVRIHPYNANMKSFVYNPVNLRLVAELDENNYATFYEYDDDGTLIRLKKETERGIKTIKETRSAMLKEQ